MKKIIINIGRQFGAGGLAVARKIGERLELPVFDKDLLKKAASESGFSVELFAEKDEKKDIFSFMAGGFGGNYLNDAELFRIQSETIRNIADQGSAVILGRCGDYILRDVEGCLNVFLTSPEEIRAQRVAQRCGISQEKAKEAVAKEDRKRAEYYNCYTFGNWGVASNYDLCIDSSILGIDGTADMIIDFARKAGLIL